MNTMLQAVRQFAADEDGVTAIEYGLIAALIVGAVSTILTTMGTNLGKVFTGIGNLLTLS